MTIQVLGRRMRRDTVEALIEKMIAALDSADADSDFEPEYDEDDQRWLPKCGMTTQSTRARSTGIFKEQSMEMLVRRPEGGGMVSRGAVKVRAYASENQARKLRAAALA